MGRGRRKGREVVDERHLGLAGPQMPPLSAPTSCARLSTAEIINKSLRRSKLSCPVMPVFERGAGQRNRRARSELDHHVLSAGQGVLGPLT